MFSPNISKLVLCLDVVDGDGAGLYQFLNEEIPQRDVLCSRGVGVISGNTKRRRVVDEQRNTVESILKILAPASCSSRRRPLSSLERLRRAPRPLLIER